MPPALCANAGMDVPEIPSVVARRTTVSSATARYTGSARAIAAPPFPLSPWQPAQFWPYSTLKSVISLGTIGVSAAVGRPGAPAHPHNAATESPKVPRMIKWNLIAVRPSLGVPSSCPALLHRHAPEMARAAAWVLAPGAPLT